VEALLTQPASTRAYSRGATIFTNCDPGASLFVVCSGTTRIAVSSPDGRDAVYNLIGEGEIFGEIALLDGQPTTADATAVTVCELMLIDCRDFRGPAGEPAGKRLEARSLKTSSARGCPTWTGPPWARPTAATRWCGR
jgi:CRP-like cAMP-binding protein